MSWLLRLFTGNPVMMVYVALAIAAAAGSAGAYSGWMLNGWRLGEALERAEGERDQAIAQGRVLAGGLEACNAGVKRVEQLSGEALASMKKMVLAAQRLHSSGKAMVDELEERLKKPATGKTCDDAWSEIERMRGP